MGPDKFFHVKSSKFSKLPGEEDEIVNDFMYGKALCKYLKDSLTSKGVSVTDWFNEDWGWYVRLEGYEGGFKSGLFVYCLNGEEATDQYAVLMGAQKIISKGFFRKKIIDQTSEVERLEKILIEIFSTDADVEFLGISDDPWEVPEDEDSL